MLVRVLGDGDCDRLHGVLVLKVDLPPALPARLGRETAGVGVAVGRQFGVVVPQRRRLLRRSPQGQVPACKSIGMTETETDRQTARQASDDKKSSTPTPNAQRVVYVQSPAF